MSYFSCELLKSPHKLNARAKDKKKRWEEENSYVHLRLNGNSLEIAHTMKNWIFFENNSIFDHKTYRLFQEKSGFLGVIFVLSG